MTWLVLVLAGLAPLLGVWLFGAVRLWSVGPLSVTTFLAIGLCALHYFVAREPMSLRLPPGFIPFALFVVYGFLLIPRAAVPYDAWVESLKVASYVGAYWVWTELSGAKGRWRWIAAAYLLVVSVMAWYALIQHAHDSRMVLNLERPAQYLMRASGAYFCPNHFANLLEITIPFAAALAMAPAAGLPLRLLAGYSVVVCLPPLYLTESRSGWLGVLAGMAVTAALLALRRSVRRFLVMAIAGPLALAALALAVWALSPMVQHRVADALGGNIRLQLWQDTWLMIQDQPWWGWGPLSFRWVYPHYWKHMAMNLDPSFAHNDYLQLWAEYGLLGVVLLGSALAVAAGRWLLRVRKCESERGACLIAGLLGAWTAALVHAMFDYNFHIFGNVHCLMMMSGLVAGVVLHAESFSDRPTSPGASRWVALAGLPALLAGALMAQAVLTYTFVLQGESARVKFRLDSAQALFEKAQRVNDRNWEADLGLGRIWAARAFWNRDPEAKEEQAGQALKHYERTLAANPWDTDALIGQSKALHALGRPEEALQTLQELTRRVPRHPYYWNHVGAQFRRMGRYQEALDTFLHARALGPNALADRNIEALRRKLAAPTAAPSAAP